MSKFLRTHSPGLYLNDTLRSAIQKAIRRGLLDLALFAAGAFLKLRNWLILARIRWS